MVETVKYRVRRRDTLSNIVARAGFPARDWNRIYNAGFNRQFKKDFPDPNLIQPGATLILPRYNPSEIQQVLARIEEVQVRIEGAEQGLRRLEPVVTRARRELRTAEDARRIADENAAFLESVSAGLCRDLNGIESDCNRKLTEHARRMRRVTFGEGTALDRRIETFLAEARRAERDISRAQARLEALRRILTDTRARLATLRSVLNSLRSDYRRMSRDPYR